MNSPVFKGDVPDDAEILDVEGERPGIHDYYLVRMSPSWTDGHLLLVRSTNEEPDVLWAALNDEGGHAELPPDDQSICESVFQHLRLKDPMVMCNCTEEAI